MQSFNATVILYSKLKSLFSFLNVLSFTQNLTLPTYLDSRGSVAFNTVMILSSTVYLNFNCVSDEEIKLLSKY